MLVMIIITVITTLRKYDICEGGIAFYETRSFSFSYESPSASRASCERPVESAPSGGHEGGFDPAKAVAGACETPAAVEASFAAAVWGPDGEVVPGDSAIIVQFLGVSRG